MSESYVEIPHNYDLIKAYVISEREKIETEIIRAKKCFFYDTCSFRKHANMKHPEYVFEFINRYEGIVIITRCILMELASHSGILNVEYIEYMKKMYDADIKLFVIYEEDLFDVLSVCFSVNAVINKHLSTAVKVVKSRAGTVEGTLKENKRLANDVFKEHNADGTLFEMFFQEVRKHKASGDNLGEELIVICLHMLANIPEAERYKYVILTDDRGAIGLVNKAVNNIKEHGKMVSFSALTTARLAQRMYEENIICQKVQVEEVLATGNPENNIRILGSETYDLKPMDMTVACSELAEMIVTPNAIHINY